jgi:uncharacterized protein (DUF1499 family)
MSSLLKWSNRLLLFLGIASALVFTGGQMGLLSGSRPSRLGLDQGQLHAIKTNLQNSVSSFTDSEYHKIAPISASKEPREVFARVVEAVKAMPGATVITKDPNYLYAEFQTPLLKFVDDVEFLLDEGNGVIHVRSASRLGRKDFGVNRKRIEAIRQSIQTRLG